jgi:Lrp/AsnC family transcriptional regulator for asnA, asnC and gidA
MSKKRVKLDSIDLQIIHHLWDGRTPYSDIADKVGLTANTVRTRVNRMLDSNAVQIICLVNPYMLENHQSAIIGFKTLPEQSKKALERITSLKGVVTAARVAGRFDIVAIMIFNHRYTYETFIREEVPKVEEIISMETFFAFGSDNYQLRYVL